jgi:hypothetical protein
MYENLFDRIQSQTKENLFTETLAYLLTRREYALFQKLFYYQILNTHIDSQNARVLTQQTFDSSRPDILIELPDTVIIIEVKLGASLSFEKQLLPYAQILSGKNFTKYFARKATSTKRCIVALAPAWTIKQCEAECEAKFKKTVHNHFENLGVSYSAFNLTHLSELLKAPRELILNDLANYIEVHVEKELTMQQLELLRNKEIGKAIEAVYAKVSEVYNSIDTKKYPVDRISPGYYSYGFCIYLKNNEKIWFGYAVYGWSLMGAPVILQYHDSWFTKPKTDKKRLKKAGFEEWPDDYGYVRSIDISKPKWLDEITAILDVLNE